MAKVQDSRKKNTIKSTIDCQAMLREAVSLHQQGHLQPAKNIYTQILKQQSNNADALHLIGLVAFQQGKFKQADRRISNALKLQSSEASFYSNLGAVRKARGMLADAQKLYKKALELNPSHSASHNNLANIYQQNDNFNDAIKHYNLALKYNPHYAEALYNLGLIHFKQEDLLNAESYLAQALEKSPNYADAKIALGEVRLKQKRYAEAAELFSFAEDTDKVLDKAKSFLSLGQCYQRLNDTSEAIKAYRKAVKYCDNSLFGKEIAASAEHFLSVLAGLNPEKPSEIYVQAIFDHHAENFEKLLTEDLSYSTPTQLSKVLQSQSPTLPFSNALDLGCGTGLAAVEFKSFVDNFVGVDLSEKMLSKAAEKGLYSYLEKNELLKFLTNHTERYPLVIAADVFVYIGNLQPIFEAVNSHMDLGGYFVFSTEQLANGNYQLLTSGRYAHSQDYIQTLAEQNGFIVLLAKTTDLRKEKGKWIKGDLYVLRKS